ELHVAEVASADQIEPAFESLVKRGAKAVLLLQSPLFGPNRVRLAALALRHRVALVSEGPPVVEAGGLMSYRPALQEPYARVAYYVERIYKGASPSELPVEQPTKFQLVINVGTAKKLGLAIPKAMLLRADQTIE